MLFLNFLKLWYTSTLTHTTCRGWIFAVSGNQGCFVVCRRRLNATLGREKGQPEFTVFHSFNASKERSITTAKTPLSIGKRVHPSDHLHTRRYEPINSLCSLLQQIKHNHPSIALPLTVRCVFLFQTFLFGLNFHR